MHGQFQFISPFGRMRPRGSSSSGNLIEHGFSWSSLEMKITLSLPNERHRDSDIVSRDDEAVARGEQLRDSHGKRYRSARVSPPVASASHSVFSRQYLDVPLFSQSKTFNFISLTIIHMNDYSFCRIFRREG